MVKWTIFLVVVYVQAMSAAPAPDARTYYAQGLTAITAKKWSDAKFALEMSYRLNANSMTAYLLALASSRLGNIGDTETWAVVSLTDEPPLPKHYKFQAVKLISWAVAMSAKVTVVRWRYLLSRDQPTSHNLALLEALSEVRLPVLPDEQEEAKNAYEAEKARVFKAFDEKCRLLAQMAESTDDDEDDIDLSTCVMSPDVDLPSEADGPPPAQPTEK